MAKGIQVIRLFENIRSMLVSGDDLNETDIVILVLGTAGSGKTSFVNKVAQKCHLQVGHDLSSGTKKLSPVSCNSKTELPRIVLVDTPPFPDDRGEEEILEWLKNIRFKVNGILYLHPITANRGQPEEEYKRLRRLSHRKLRDVPVILVTTFWRPDSPPTHETRMQELEDGWNSADIKGPLPTKYNDSADCAWNIINTILKEGGIDLAKHHAERQGY